VRRARPLTIDDSVEILRSLRLRRLHRDLIQSGRPVHATGRAGRAAFGGIGRPYGIQCRPRLAQWSFPERQELSLGDADRAKTRDRTDRGARRGGAKVARGLRRRHPARDATSAQQRGARTESSVNRKGLAHYRPRQARHKLGRACTRSFRAEASPEPSRHAPGLIVGLHCVSARRLARMGRWSGA